MRYFVYFILSLCFLPALSAQAQTQRFFTDLHVLTDTVTVSDQEQTAAKGESLLVIDARFPRVVKLQDEVVIGNGANAVKLPAGAILFGRYDKTVWVYCALANLEPGGQALNAIVGGIFTGGLNLLTGSYKGSALNCLQDTDHDGVFDAGWSNGTAEAESPLIAYVMLPRAISAQSPYERLDVNEGPTFPIEFHWIRPKKTGNVTLQARIGLLKSSSKSVPVPAVGDAPQKVEIWGAEFEIISYDAETKTLTYRVLRGPNRQYARIPAMKTITTTYYYY